MKIRFLVILLAFLSFSNEHFAQKRKSKNSGEVKFGLQFRPIIPIDYFGAGPQELSDTIVNLTIAPKLGYNIGMVIRKDFTEMLSLETGINYIRRNFNVDSYESKRDTADHTDFGFVAYQIPIQGLVYIKLSDNIYMNTSGGLGIDWYASAVASVGDRYLINHLSLKRYWMNFSVLANVGFEYRTEKSGSFYIGGSFVNPLNSITDTKVVYYYGNTDKTKFETELKGTYITIDLRYFFN